MKPKKQKEKLKKTESSKKLESKKLLQQKLIEFPRRSVRINLPDLSSNTNPTEIHQIQSDSSQNQKEKKRRKILKREKTKRKNLIKAKLKNKKRNRKMEKIQKTRKINKKHNFGVQNLKKTVNPFGHLKESFDQTDEYKSWSFEKKRLWKTVDTNPELFYFFHCGPYEKEITSNYWQKSERENITRKLKQHPVNNERWGLFSMNIIGRTGKQCKRFYKKLLLAEKAVALKRKKEQRERSVLMRKPALIVINDLFPTILTRTIIIALSLPKQALISITPSLSRLSAIRFSLPDEWFESSKQQSSFKTERLLPLDSNAVFEKVKKVLVRKKKYIPSKQKEYFREDKDEASQTKHLNKTITNNDGKTYNSDKEIVNFRQMAKGEQLSSELGRVRKLAKKVRTRKSNELDFEIEGLSFDKVFEFEGNKKSKMTNEQMDWDEMECLKRLFVYEAVRIRELMIETDGGHLVSEMEVSDLLHKNKELAKNEIRLRNEIFKSNVLISSVD